MQPASLSRNCPHPKESAPLLPPSLVVGVTAEFKGLAPRSQLEISPTPALEFSVGLADLAVALQCSSFYFSTEFCFPGSFLDGISESTSHTQISKSNQLLGPALRKEEVSFTLIHYPQDAKNEGIHRKTWKGSQSVEYGFYQLLSTSG